MTLQQKADELTYHTLGEVAAVLRVSQGTLRRQMAIGKGPPGVKIYGTWRFEDSALQAWIAAQYTGRKEG